MSFETKIGHAHLKVRDLNRAVAFYEKYLNLKLVERVADQYVFMSAGDFHHDIALQKVADDAPANIPQGVGLYHVAFEVPDRRSFALAYKAMVDGGIQVAPVDHLISWAMYFDDPDGNGLEIYLDTRHTDQARPLWGGKNIELSAEKILSALSDAS